MNGDGIDTGSTGSSFGVSHLSSLPITTTFGFVLLVVLVILVWMRVAFGKVSVSGSAGA